MPLDLDRLVQNLDPEHTILFFGAGSSIPSGCPSASELSSEISKKFHTGITDLTLSEIAELAELTSDRRQLIEFLRSCFPRPNPTGGLLNIPLIAWKGVYTTNYDELLENVYRIRSKAFHVITTNFDFSIRTSADSQAIYKIHGTINKDVCYGDRSRIIITQGDYDKTREYREYLYDRLSSDMAGASLVIVGHSLSDRDIKDVVDRALAIQAKLEGAGGQIFLLMYQRDEARAKLFEARGVRVSFGGIDEFSEVLARRGPAASIVFSEDDDPVQQSRALSATTIDVSHALSAFRPNASAMFNGWPATYADIKAQLTFARTMTNTITKKFTEQAVQFATLVGASGVGKTTAARQILTNLEGEGWLAWEHKTDFDLSAKDWEEVAGKLKNQQRYGVVLIDDAQFHLPEINRLVENLSAAQNNHLYLLLTASRGQWQMRTKAFPLTKQGYEEVVSRLNSQEIDRLILLVSGRPEIKPLVETTFNGFSFQEKRARLQTKCDADAFVCLRNIFATERFDDIILREYAQLSPEIQEVYKTVAAMEYAGVRVHRQLVLRVTGLATDTISSAITAMVDVVSEYDVSERYGIYGWKVRHEVIAGIISRYKFSAESEKIDLFDRIILSLSPSYEIERRTINEMCNVDTGLPSIGSKAIQNGLLRKLISIAPGEPIPRHRLIRNLIDLEKFDLAETEIRVFKTDIGFDGPVARYEVALQLARALHSPGLMDEDRVFILGEASGKARGAVERFANSRQVHTIFCDVGLELYRLTGDASVFDEAMKGLKNAETRTGDDLITKAIRNYERRWFGSS